MVAAQVLVETGGPRGEPDDAEVPGRLRGEDSRAVDPVRKLPESMSRVASDSKSDLSRCRWARSSSQPAVERSVFTPPIATVPRRSRDPKSRS